MPTTGETCLDGGTYICACKRGHTQEIRLNRGDIYPPCGFAVSGEPCAAIVEWTLKPERTH